MLFLGSFAQIFKMKVFAMVMAVYFLFGSIFPRTDFSQLAKVPNVFKHYECHVAESIAKGETPSFSGFLMDHFFGSLDEDHKDPSHHQLPLKSMGLDFQFVLSKPIPFRVKAPVIKSEKHFYTRSLQGKDFSDSFFQPPIQA